MKSYEIDMCHGSLFGKIVLFAVPLILTSTLQLVFNAADLIVIGHYAHFNAQAAIGATFGLNALVINMLIGTSVGANVVVARCFGAHDLAGISRATHTAILLAVTGGVIVAVIGIAAARPLLELMKTPEEIMPQACLYSRICFVAIPVMMLYNFGCAILRAIGDTRRPLIYLAIGGVVNVLLNLFFVIVCKMDVDGVALATAASHAISAALILRALLRSTGKPYKLVPKRLRFDPALLREILRIGLPAGLQGACFSISNMTLQSSINTLGAAAMAGTTATLGIESIVHVGSFAMHHAAVSFVAQNFGGGKFKRIPKCIGWCLLCAAVCSLVSGWGAFLAGRQLLSIFNPDPVVIEWGLVRMRMLFTSYFICGMMDVIIGAVRGLGYSLSSTLIMIFGVCVFRILWVLYVFPKNPTMQTLLLSYPISWFFVGISGGALMWFLYRRMLRRRVRHLAA